MSRNAKMAIFAIVMIALILLAGKCAYGAGEWLGAQ